eukprot:GHVL01041945.1.p1 GENE.GHVL01041945.1~~GHVL01041945.1.p1  ORF type:complete len:541 (+),score=103.45 GHVL01041945.1:210-1832(+)
MAPVENKKNEEKRDDNGRNKYSEFADTIRLDPTNAVKQQDDTINQMESSRKTLFETKSECKGSKKKYIAESLGYTISRQVVIDGELRSDIEIDPRYGDGILEKKRQGVVIEKRIIKTDEKEGVFDRQIVNFRDHNYGKGSSDDKLNNSRCETFESSCDSDRKNEKKNLERENDHISGKQAKEVFDVRGHERKKFNSDEEGIHSRTDQLKSFEERDKKKGVSMGCRGMGERRTDKHTTNNHSIGEETCKNRGAIIGHEETDANGNNIQRSVSLLVLDFEGSDEGRRRLSSDISSDVPVVNVTMNDESVGRLQSLDDFTAIESRSERPRTLSPCGNPFRKQIRPMSKHEALYHQGIAAFQEQQKVTKERQAENRNKELKECTFKPTMITNRSNKGPRFGAGDVKGFQSNVNRMRVAAQQRQELQKKRENIPRGENYEKLRSKGVRPFSFGEGTCRPNRKKAVLFVDVHLGGGKRGRIGVHENDTPAGLAENFSKIYNLDPDMTARLALLLLEHMQALAARSPQQRQSYDQSMERRYSGGYLQ